MISKNTVEKNNFRGGIKMEKSLTKIKNSFKDVKMKIALALVLFAILAAIVFAQTVSHPASQIISGTFPVGDFELQNDLTVDTGTLHVNSNTHRVGIGTTNPGEKLEVDGNINVSGTSDVCITGGNCLSAAGTDTNAGTICTTADQYLGGDGNCLTKREVLEYIGWSLPGTINANVGYHSEDLHWFNNVNLAGFKTLVDLKYHVPHIHPDDGKSY